MTRTWLRISSAALIAAFVLPASGSSHHAAEASPPTPSPAAGGAAMARFPLVHVVRYRPGAAYRHERPLLQQDLRAHSAYMREQSEKGVIIAAGPTFDQAGGIVLIRVGGMTEAEAFVQSDPAVAAGIFAAEITDWRPVFDRGAIFREAPANGE